MNSTRFSRFPLGLAGVAMTAVLLTACGREEEQRTAGQKLDDGIATVEQKAEAAKNEAQQQAGEVKSSVEQAAHDLGTKAEAATDKAMATMDDAAITVAVNAALAKDGELSALKIDVDTKAGHVRLSGKAPSASARDRATTLARGVEGVVGVDNQLRVGS